LPATLIGLHGEKLFQALVALRLPADATKNVHLEVALAARHLALQEFVDLHIHVYEEVVYIGIYKAVRTLRRWPSSTGWKPWTPLFRSTLTSLEKSLLLSRRLVACHTESRRRRSLMDASFFLPHVTTTAIASSWP
jgi:hypothetical protein